MCYSVSEADETLIKDDWNSLTSIVAAQQHSQEVRWLFDQLRCDFEDMPEDELLGRIFPQWPGAWRFCASNRASRSPRSKAVTIR